MGPASLCKRRAWFTPGIGHRSPRWNLEYLAKGVLSAEDISEGAVYYPETLGADVTYDHDQWARRRSGIGACGGMRPRQSMLGQPVVFLSAGSCGRAPYGRPRGRCAPQPTLCCASQRCSANKRWSASLSNYFGERLCGPDSHRSRHDRRH